MTKEKIFKEFLEDPLIMEKNYLSKEQIKKLRFIDNCNIKLVEVIKIAINGSIEGESSNVISRKINQFLNRE